MGTNSTGCTEWERDYDPVTEQPMTSKTVELLDAGSLFLYIASADDIEHERQYMEFQYDRQLGVHEIEHPTHSGARCTRVTWEVL